MALVGLVVLILFRSAAARCSSRLLPNAGDAHSHGRHDGLLRHPAQARYGADFQSLP
ncbi:MAG: hypothetical protein WKG07_24295 [Hymenobacter sp.]